MDWPVRGKGNCPDYSRSMPERKSEKWISLGRRSPVGCMDAERNAPALRRLSLQMGPVAAWGRCIALRIHSPYHWILSVTGSGALPFASMPLQLDFVFTGFWCIALRIHAPYNWILSLPGSG